MRSFLVYGIVCATAVFGHSDCYSGVTLDVLKDAALAAKDLFMEGLHAEQTVKAGDQKEKQSSKDIATLYDMAVEKVILKFIMDKFPDHTFYGEETKGPKARLTAAPTWIVDPIDGTHNYLFGNPMCVISIAFAVNRKVVLGVVYQPATDEMYSAEVGHGATLNDRVLQLSPSTPPFRHAVVSLASMNRSNARLEKKDLSRRERNRIIAADKQADKIYQGMKHAGITRYYGACALELCYLAAGRIHVSVYMEDIYLFDWAAGKLILEEAGGVFSDQYGNLNFRGIPRGHIAASNMKLFRKVKTFL